MKFVCDRCQTRYSIADEKVRGKILKVRCKSCQNVITVRETGVAGPEMSVLDTADDRTVLANLPAPTPSVARPADSHRPAPTAPQRPLMPPPAPPPAAAAAAPAPDLIQWFMALEGKQSGPYSRKGLLDKLAAMPAGADVHVWNERMDGWKPPEQVPSLARELQSRRRPVPPLPGGGHAGPHPVPGVPGRTTTGSQPVVPVAPAGARRPSRSLPIPAGSAGGPGAGHEVLPLAAAAAEPAPNGAHPSAPRAKKAAGLGALNGAGGAVAPAMVPLTLDPNDVPEMPEDPSAEGVVASTLAPTAGTDVAHPSSNWQSTSVPLVATPGRNRSTKLILGSLGIVTVLVVLVTYALTLKVPAPVVIAEKAKATAPAGDDFNKLADQLAQDKGKESAVVNGPPAPTVAPMAAVEPSRNESTAVVRGKNGKLKKNNRRGGGKGVGQVTPPAFTGAATGAAVPDNSGPSTGSFGGPERKVGTVGGGGGARSTPSQAEIARVINNNKAGIKLCYQRALLRDSTLTHGKIVVKLTLGLSGRVKSVVIDGPQPFLALQPCIKDMVSRWGFPPSSEEYGSEFAYVFQGNE